MKRRQFILASGTVLGAAYMSDVLAANETNSWMQETTTNLESDLITKYGASQRERIQRGLKQVGNFWRKEDGSRDVFEEFVRTNFAGDQSTLDQLFDRFQQNLEQYD